MALVGVELETLVSEPDALTIRPPPLFRFDDHNESGSKAHFFYTYFKCLVYSLGIFYNAWSCFCKVFIKTLKLFQNVIK